MSDVEFDQFLKLSQQYSTCRNKSQHIATGWPNAHNMLRPVAFKCCDRSAEALHKQDITWV